MKDENSVLNRVQHSYIGPGFLDMGVGRNFGLTLKIPPSAERPGMKCFGSAPIKGIILI